LSAVKQSCPGYGVNRTPDTQYSFSHPRRNQFAPKGEQRINDRERRLPPQPRGGGAPAQRQ